MRKGDIVFVRGGTFFSKIVNVFDGEFSHVAILLSDKGEKGSILEAQSFKGSRIVPFYFDDYETLDLGFTEEQRDKLVQLSVDLTGLRYDYRYLFSVLMHKLFKIKRTNNPRDMICSELLAYLLIQLKWVGPEEDVAEILNFTPNELYRYLYAKKQGQIVVPFVPTGSRLPKRKTLSRNRKEVKLIV